MDAITDIKRRCHRTRAASCNAARNLARTRFGIANLRSELAETNQGVVALYAELEDKAEQLKQASELKSRFLSYMSHEFRTPLGSIRSIARILLDRMDGPLTSEQEKQVEFMRTSAEELTEMVNDLLDLAKIEAGRISISPAWFEMVDLFAAIRGMFKPILTSEAVSLIFEEPVECVPRIYTDDKKLSQILRNFISNALKFTVKGEVRVSACADDDARDLFSGGHRHRHRQGTSRGDLRGFCAGGFADPEKAAAAPGWDCRSARSLPNYWAASVSLESELGVGSTFSVTLPIHLNSGTVETIQWRRAD